MVVSCSVVAAVERIMACASPTIKVPLKCEAKALGNNYLHGHLNSTVSYSVSHTFCGLSCRIRVNHHAYGSNHIARALKNRYMGTTISSTNGSLKIPGKVLFRVFPDT